MKKRKQYSGEFKAKVVKEFTQTNRKMEIEALAEKYQVHPNQIRNWKCQLFKQAHLIFDDRRLIKKETGQQYLKS